MLKSNKKIHKKITATFVIIVFLAVIFLFIEKSLAASVDMATPGSIGLGNADLITIVIRIIQIFLGLLGIIAISLVLYGGFIWMTSAGNEEKISRAKKILVNAAIGLAIILASFAIVTFIFNKINDALNPPGTVIPNNPAFPPGLAIGGGIIENVYPLPNSQNNYRNTLIMVTFKEAVTNIIDSSDQTFQTAHCQGYGSNPCGKLLIDPNTNQPSVKIINNSTNYGNYKGIPIPADQVVVASDAVNKNFVFDPIEDIGSSESPTDYTTTLTSYIKKLSNGQSALALGFDWSFGVGTFSDNTPPTVVSVFPAAASTVARNAGVQINFSEAINPITATGQSTANLGDPFNNIILKYIDGQNDANVPGNYVISNQYKTITFLSNLSCDGVIGPTFSSCGNQIYCLPGDKTFNAKIESPDPPPDIGIDGIRDAAGNSLDGDKDGVMEVNDDYNWEFSTNNLLHLTPPVLESVDPIPGDTNIPLNTQVLATFDEELNGGKVNSTNFILIKATTACRDSNIAQPVYGQYQQLGQLGCFPDYGFNVGFSDPTNKIIRLTVFGNLDSLFWYNPRALSYIEDMFQNCFQPATQQPPVPPNGWVGPPSPP